MQTPHLRNEASDEAGEKLRRHAQHTTMEALRKMLQDAKAVKPSVGGKTYDTHQAELKELYENKQERLTRNELKRRFPKAHKKMPVECAGIVRRIAREEAAAYGQAPDRWMTIDGIRPRLEVPEDKDGNAIPPKSGKETDDPKLVERAKSFDNVITRARSNKYLREAERILMASKTVFLRLGWRGQQEGRADIDDADVVTFNIYWPHQVHVISHHDDAENLHSAVAVIAETTGPGGGLWYEVWTRETTPSQMRHGVAFESWRVECIPAIVDDDDEREPYWLFGDGHYPLPTLPWVVLHDGLPSGSVYVDTDRDIVRTQLNMNAMWSDHFHAIDYGAHGQYYVQSDRIMQDRTPVTVGPGKLAAVGSNDSFGKVPSDINDAPMTTSAQRLRLLAVQRDQPAHRFDTEQSVVHSGVSRRVEDIPATRARAERVIEYKDVEETVILPIVVEIADFWGGMNIAHTRQEQEVAGERDKSVRYHVTFSDPPVYESDEAKERHAANLLANKVISPARYAFMSGAYASVDDAIEQGVSDEIEQGSSVPDGGGLMGFASALQATPVPGQANDDVEVDDEDVNA